MQFSEIILASQSPRRQELLKEMGVAFRSQPSEYEEVHDESRPTSEVIKELALGKALDIAERFPDALVIGSDTIVEFDGRQLGKPVDENDAYETLVHLNGKVHDVLTGVALVCLSQNIRRVEVAQTNVVFKTHTPGRIREYVATGDPLDKAGSYGAQSKGGFLVDHYEGDIGTVIGFPTYLVSDMFAELGIESKPVELNHGGRFSR